MSDAGRGTWATFLTQMTSRPGWSVARLARESGIHRSTIFRWIKGDGGLTMASVEAIAGALGIPKQTALLAAGNMLGAPTEERDEEREIILAADVDEDTKRRMLERLLELRERDRQRRIDDIRFHLGRGA